MATNQWQWENHLCGNIYATGSGAITSPDRCPNLFYVEDAESIIFDDVPCSKYYYESVTCAAVNNITSGTSATTFSPDRTISRAEALTFLYLIMGQQA